MAEENEDGQEKTEEPSQRKIEKAKEDGNCLLYTSDAADDQ